MGNLRFARPTLRCTLILALALGVLSRSLPAETPAGVAQTTFLGDPGVDVEKAREHARDQRKTELEWIIANSWGAYERVGKKDPRWDDYVHKIIITLAPSMAYSTQPPIGADEGAKGFCEQALAAGCNDELVKFFGLALQCYPPGTSHANVARLWAEEEQAMEKTAYPPYRKFFCSLNALKEAAAVVGSFREGQPAPTPPPGTNFDASLSRAQAHLLEFLRDPTLPPLLAARASQRLYDVKRFDVVGNDLVCDPLAEAFEKKDPKAPEESLAAEDAEGLFWLKYAWNGRTGNVADNVTDNQWKKFQHRLPKAQALLERAYARDPSDEQAPLEMMRVELGQGQGEERERLWFRRAMDANPDSYKACEDLVFYLEPKWYGDAGKMLEFAHRCEATGDWAARLPFMVLQAHTDLAQYETPPSSYWTRPAVWADIKDLYTKCFAANPPGSLFDRSAYALEAYKAHQWKLADQLFKALDGKPDLKAMGCSQGQYESMCELAASKVAGGTDADVSAPLQNLMKNLGLTGS